MAVFGTVRFIPVAERNAIRRFVQERVQRCDQRVEIFAPAGQRSGPDQPVGLGPELAAVERQTILLLRRAVKGQLGGGHLCREQVKAQRPVPDQVVLHRPRVRLVEGQPIRAAASAPCRLDPLRHHRLGQPREAFGRGGVPVEGRHLAVAGQSHDRLERKVGIMGQMSGKIVGAELVVGIKPFGRQILGPARDGRPPLRGKGGAVLDVRKRTEADQHIAALFDRHLVLFAPLAASVALAVAQRVLADIVRREVERPARVRGVKQDGRERGARQRGAQQREVRQLRVEHIDGPHTAVAGVLLGKIERLAVRIGDQLAGRERLTVGQRRKRGVFFAADTCEIGHQLCVKGCHTRVKRRVIAFSRRQHLVERKPVPPPPRLERPVEEHHRIDIVICHQQVGLGRCRRAEIVREHERRPRFARGDTSARRRSHPEVSPVNADTVARTPQDRLGVAPHAPGVESVDLRLAEHDRLRIVAHRDGGGHVHRQLKRAWLAVAGLRLKRDIRDRT